MQALEDLDYLAALDDDGNLSEVGIIMSELPLEPPLAKALIAACEYDCVDELLTIGAMLTGQCGLPRPLLSCPTAALKLSCLSAAPSCFVAPEPGGEEAAVALWRPLLHAEGDHMTLVNIYNAFMERTCNKASNKSQNSHEETRVCWAVACSQMRRARLSLTSHCGKIEKRTLRSYYIPLICVKDAFEVDLTRFHSL